MPSRALSLIPSIGVGTGHGHPEVACIARALSISLISLATTPFLAAMDLLWVSGLNEKKKP